MQNEFCSDNNYIYYAISHSACNGECIYEPFALRAM